MKGSMASALVISFVKDESIYRQPNQGPVEHSVVPLSRRMTCCTTAGMSLISATFININYFSDCALDSTCVMCERCFVYDVHKDHNYWYTVCSDDSGGSCDCGEEDSWKTDLHCPHHAPVTDNSDAFNFSKKGEAYVMDFLDGAVEAIKSFTVRVCDPPLDELDSKVIILYNDEKHSFAEVIVILSEELSIDREAASAYAIQVDTLVRETSFATVSNLLGLCSGLFL